MPILYIGPTEKEENYDGTHFYLIPIQLITIHLSTEYGPLFAEISTNYEYRHLDRRKKSSYSSFIFSAVNTERWWDPLKSKGAAKKGFGGSEVRLFGRRTAQEEELMRGVHELQLLQ